MTILETIRKAFGRKTESADQAYRNLLEAVADGKSPDNAFQVIEAAGKSLEDFESAVELMTQRKGWARDIVNAESAQRKLESMSKAGNGVVDPLLTQIGIDLANELAAAAQLPEKDRGLAAATARQKAVDAGEASKGRIRALFAAVATGHAAQQLLIDTAQPQFRERDKQIGQAIEALDLETVERRWRDESDSLSLSRSKFPGETFPSLEASVLQWERRHKAAIKERDRLNADRDANRAAMLVP